MHAIIEQYGKDMVSELLDILFIHENHYSVDWLAFAHKYELVSKRTKNIRRNVWHTIYQNQWTVHLQNGRGQTVLLVIIRDEDLPQIRKELAE